MHLILDIKKIKSFKGGYDYNFSYLIWDEITLEGAIIDPAVQPDTVFDFISNNNIQLSKILITHTHHDHIVYLNDFLQKYSNIDIYAYAKTRQTIEGNFNGVIHQGQILIGEINIKVLYTPGHYDDCVCYWIQDSKILFTGDTVFVGRSGRTISNYSNISQLYSSIYNIILKLPADTTIYSGHDYGERPFITIGENINLSPFFSCNSENEFVQIMKNFESNR